MARDASPEDILDRLFSPGGAGETGEVRALRAAVLAEIRSTAEGQRCFEGAHQPALGPAPRVLRLRPSPRFSAAAAVVTVLAALLIPALAFSAVVNIGRLLRSGGAFGGASDALGLGGGPGAVLTGSLIHLVACSTVAAAIVLVMGAAGGPGNPRVAPTGAPRRGKDHAGGGGA
jgi:hypothetical protein